jgi:hypothetical protein
MARKRLEEIEAMMDAAIERQGHHGVKKQRHQCAKHIESGVKLRLSEVEVDDAESDSLVRKVRNRT